MGLSGSGADHKMRGDQFLRQAKFEQAAACYRQSISFSPNAADAHLNLGFALSELRQYAEAKRCLQRAIGIDPTLVDAFYLLGTGAQRQGQLDEAIGYFREVLKLDAGFEPGYLNLCHVLFESGKQAEAKTVILKGLSVNPARADYHCYLGNLYHFDMAFEQAAACFQKALSIRPDYAEAYSNLGEVFRKQNDFDQALVCYRKALSINPDFFAAHSNLLLTLSFQADASAAQCLEQAMCYGREVAARAKPCRDWPATARRGGPLRIGFVSGDLNNHPVAFFLESLAAHVNPASVEMVVYATQAREDHVTVRLKRHFSAWNSIAGDDDETAARKIHDDGIHILIDLAGHTAHNRLPVFAWKPAPVQASWLGYWASTGVPGIDYVLADPDTPSEHFTETVWRLPDIRYCFTPPAAQDQIPVMPPPALNNGHVTFGSFQAIAKLNDAVLALWGRIFDALPAARLRLQSGQLSDAANREALLQRLAQAGIAAARVTLQGPMPREHYLTQHAEVDIILDTFPFPGGTTTCEALWMGVPTVTLPGGTLLSRQGASLMTCVGLPDWIANDEHDYVAKAVGHASDLERLARLREKLREQALASPLFDAPRFARSMENALHGMWRERMSSAE
jgi:predicted O-linked N-acetylglucosamine transferase (SPINDLY family)